jgi:hypothetical protein
MVLFVYFKETSESYGLFSLQKKKSENNKHTAVSTAIQAFLCPQPAARSP